MMLAYEMVRNLFIRAHNMAMSVMSSTFYRQGTLKDVLKKALFVITLSSMQRAKNMRTTMLVISWTVHWLCSWVFRQEGTATELVVILAQACSCGVMNP